MDKGGVPYVDTIVSMPIHGVLKNDGILITTFKSANKSIILEPIFTKFSLSFYMSQVVPDVRNP